MKKNIRRLLPFKIAASLAIAAVCASESHAYFSTIDNGDLLKPGQYQAAIEPQLILDKYNGFNVIGRFDTGFNDNANIRGVVGFGKVDFQLGGFYKIVPFPDTEDQPAIGFDIGAIYARVGGDNQLSLRVHPIVSKKFETEIGDLTPYGSIPLGVTSRKDDTVTPVQVVIGNEFRPLNSRNISYFTELGVTVSNAFSYISAAIAYRFDDASVSN